MAEIGSGVPEEVIRLMTDLSITREAEWGLRQNEPLTRTELMRILTRSKDDTGWRELAELMGDAAESEQWASCCKVLAREVLKARGDSAGDSPAPDPVDSPPAGVEFIYDPVDSLPRAMDFIDNKQQELAELADTLARSSLAEIGIDPSVLDDATAREAKGPDTEMTGATERDADPTDVNIPEGMGWDHRVPSEWLDDLDEETEAAPTTSWLQSPKGTLAAGAVAVGIGLGLWVTVFSPTDPEPTPAAGEPADPEPAAGEGADLSLLFCGTLVPDDVCTEAADILGLVPSQETTAATDATRIVEGPGGPLLICGPIVPDDACDEAVELLGLLSPEEPPLISLADVHDFADIHEVALPGVLTVSLQFARVWEDPGSMPTERDLLRALESDPFWAPYPGPTLHSSEQVEPAEPSRPETKMTAAGDVTIDPGDDAGAWAQHAFGNTVFPCGHGEVAFTVCPFEPGPPASGRHLVVFASFDADVPVTPGPDDRYTYGFVFDADDDPSNNYAPHPAFPNDFFLGTDLWFTVDWDGSAWRLAVTNARSGAFEPVASSARAIILGDTIALVVPEAEFEAPAPPYRLTAFWHRGDFGMNPPHDWSGHVQPPVSEPLTTPSGTVLDVP